MAAGFTGLLGLTGVWFATPPVPVVQYVGFGANPKMYAYNDGGGTTKSLHISAGAATKNVLVSDASGGFSASSVGAAGGTYTSGLTTNYLPRNTATDAFELADSGVSDDGTVVKINRALGAVESATPTQFYVNNTGAGDGNIALHAGNNANILIFDDANNFSIRKQPKANVGTTTNLTSLLAIETSGDVTLQVGALKFTSTARIGWTKITADNITLTAGTSSETVTDLQTAHDGNFYHITEAAATPGQHLEVEFVSVTAFNWVQIIGIYDGAGTHGLAVQLYNFSQTRWDTFDTLQTSQEDVSTANGYILDEASFFVPDDTEYIGTGGDAGDVRVRIYHTMAGNVSHDTYIDVVALYQ